MKANELRIGNLVNSDEVGITPVTPQMLVHLSSLKSLVSGFSGFIDPIPITEEWLIRFGGIYKVSKRQFRKISIDSPYYEFTGPVSGERVLIYDHKDGVYSLYNYNDSKVRIRYIHQLQNLIFALTGEELKIKES